jgi:hypothetical protein
MTKHFLFIFALVLLGNFGLQGQVCTPDMTLPDSIAVSPLPYQEAFPERGIQDTACANTYYETVFTINLPSVFVFSGFEAPIDSATIDLEGAIVNLPASLDYECNPPNCVFLPDTVGCILISGIPSTEDIGVHDLGIDVSIWTFTEYNAVLPDGIIATGNYFLHVQEEGSPNCFMVNTDEPVEGGFDLVVQPNPIRDYAEIFVRLPQTDTYTFSVYNATGAQVSQERMRLLGGEQYLPFDASQLPVGMYVFTLQGANQAASGRILVQR